MDSLAKRVQNKTSRWYVGWLPLLASMLACNTLTGNLPPGPNPTNPATLPTVAEPTAEPTATPAPSPTAIPLPPLTSLEENLFARIEAGEWTLETGLVTTMKLFVGEAEMAEVNPAGREILTSELNGIANLAAGYMETGQDEATQAELQRLLDMIFPAPERIQEYSQPVQSNISARTVNVSYRQTNCTTLWRAGWPSGTGAVCFEEQRETINGREYAVYFPIGWGTEELRRQYGALTLEAAREAVTTYSEYGDVPPANIVFTWDQDRSDAASAGAAMAALFTNPCRIAVFPSGANFLTTEGEGVFKQSIAHELFHCFQNLNLVYHPGDYPSNAWWVEATAEYFSNVVYPDVDYEHRFAPTFDASSVSQSLFQMSYANYVFFQYLGNATGNAAILDLLRELPRAGGVAGQQAYMAAYPGMADLFHEYGKRYLSGEIIDTNGSPIPVDPNLGEDVAFESETGSYDHDFEARSFVIRRMILTFPERTRHALSENGGEELTTSARLASSGPWVALPPFVNAGCQMRQFIYLLTATEATDSTFTRTVHTDVTRLPETTRCDDCLVGEWLVDNNDMWAAFQALYANVGGLYPPVLVGTSGQVRTIFYEGGLAEVRGEAFEMQYYQEVPGSGRIDATILNNSSLLTDWYTDEAGGLFVTEIYNQPEITVDAVASAGGVSLPMEIEIPPVTLLGSGEYTCTDNTLELSSYPGIFVTHTRVSR